MKKRPEQFANRDLNSELLFPTISWSSMNAFLEYDKEEWYKSYVLGQRKPPTHIMQIGIDVGERIVDDPNFLPTLERPEIFEHNLTATINGINLKGHIDGSFPSLPGIDEYKTSLSRTRWTQEKVDSWGQITFYCLLYYINFKIKPEDLRLRLWAIPIKESGDFSWEAGKPNVFYTKRTMSDILQFVSFIKRTFKDMNEFIHTRNLTQK